MTRLIAAGSDDGRAKLRNVPTNPSADFGRMEEAGAASAGLSEQENDAIVRLSPTVTSPAVEDVSMTLSAPEC